MNETTNTKLPTAPVNGGRTFVPTQKEFRKTKPAFVRNQPPQNFSPRINPAETSAYSEWKELKEQAIYAFESGLLPRSIDTAQKAVTVALMGKEVGISPLQALCGIYVVNGMAMLRGSLMLRLIYERVPGAQITVLTPPEKANVECEVEMNRPHGKAHVFRFTVEDAKKAGFMQKPIWQLHTSTMLRWAAIRTGARIVFADAIAGCYMEDEVPTEIIEEAKLPASMPATAPVAAPLEARAQEPPLPTRVRVSDLPATGGKPVTEKQVNRLFGIAHGSQWSRGQVAECLQKWFKKSDPHQLTRIEYDKICNFILDTPGPTDSIEELLQRRKAG